MKARVMYAVALAFVLSGCGSGTPPDVKPMPLTRATTDRNYLRDGYGRYVFLHGVNVSGSTKVPMTIDGKPVTLDDMDEPFAKGVPSYVGHPFPGHTDHVVTLQEVAGAADEGFRRIRDAGFNSVRLLINWEGVEPVKKGEYDQDYLKSIRSVVEAANRYGIYVLMDMHQDAFSRHLVVRYNEEPEYDDPQLGTVAPEPGSIENMLLALVPPYTDAVRGEGAPRWVVEACLQEKDLDSPYWGTPRVLRVLSQLTFADLEKLGKLLGGFLGGDGGSGVEVPPWALTLLAKNPGPFEVWETSDALPLTNWGVMSMLSIDVARMFMCMFAGDAAFPGLEVGGVGVTNYLQDAYADMWREVVKQVHDLPNVIGYDIMNEPNTNVIPLSAVAALSAFGVMDAARATLVDLLGKEDGEFIFGLLSGLGLLPPLPTKPPDPNCDQIQDAVARKQCEDTRDAALALYEADRARILKDWGLDKMDAFAILGFNAGFDKNFMKPFYEKIGKAILAEDEKAVIFIESSMNISMLLGSIAGGMWDLSMDKLDLPQVVYAPHYYADIYPFLGINQPERVFGVEEVRYRDYQPGLKAAEALAGYALGNIPVVFGEFGTYYKFGGIDASHKQGYIVSSHILDNYYEAFERMFRSQILWCWTPDNDGRYGDWWNKEDFSVQGFDGKLRSQVAWARPYARALAGRPLSTHFYGPLHYFDLNEKEVPPYGEFEVRYDSRETESPTEIQVPEVQYPDGFYVWLSDGFAYFDDETRVLYHYPTEDDPEAEHWVRLLPPLKGQENKGWNYFFKDGRVITAN